MVLEAGKSRIKAPIDSVSGEEMHSASQKTIFFALIAYGRRDQGASGVPCLRALILFVGTPLSGPNHLPKAPSPNTITLGVRISTHEFGGRPSTYSKKKKKNIFLRYQERVFYIRGQQAFYIKKIVNVLVFIGHIQSLSHSRLSLLLFVLQHFKRQFLVYKSQENCSVLIFCQTPTERYYMPQRN